VGLFYNISEPRQKIYSNKSTVHLQEMEEHCLVLMLSPWVVRVGSVTAVANCSTSAAECVQEQTERSAAALAEACWETLAVAGCYTAAQASAAVEVIMVHCCWTVQQLAPALGWDQWPVHCHCELYWPASLQWQAAVAWTCSVQRSS